MTNVENYQQTATQALEAGLLDSVKEESFVEDIKDYDKKQLKKLTSKQFHFLRDISEKYEDELDEQNH